MMNFLKRCWQNRWTRRFAWSAVTLVTLYLLLCTWLNWRWTKQWTATADMLKVEGETLDFRSLVNDPVPEADNYCAIPLLKDLALAVDNDPNKGEPAAKRKRLDAIKLPDGKSGEARPKLTNPGLAKAIDLKAWADWLRKDGSLPMPADSGNPARDLVVGLSKHDPVVSELAAGLNRPQAQWTPEWKTRDLPELLIGTQWLQYDSIRKVSQTLALRSAAAARTGEATRAHEEALIMTRLAQANLNDPFLIGLLVAASDAAMIGGITWELCDAHSGTAQDFARLESTLTVLDFHRAALRAFRSEMAASVNTMQFIKRNSTNATGLLQGDNNGQSAGITPISIAMRAVPLGLFDASAAVIADHEFKHLIKPLRDHGWKEALESSAGDEKRMMEMKDRVWLHPEYIMIALVVPAMSTTVHKAVYAQALIDQSVIACALERHRMENGSYPHSLDVVKLANGKPLPLDVMNGKPMGYRETTDGKYLLWSVGYDEKDDGGKRAVDGKNPEKTRFSDANYSGDWVWDFSGSATERVPDNRQ